MDSHAVIAIDRDGIIKLWSAGAQARFGFTSDEQVGRSIETIIPPEYRERHRAAFAAAIERGGTKITDPAANIPVLHRDGSFRRYPGRLILLRGPHGEAIGALGIYGDPDAIPEGAPPLHDLQ